MNEIQIHDIRAVCLDQVRFHNGGYCWQLARLAGDPSWKPRKFHAVFLSFAHPVYGKCLIDTGYGPAMRIAQNSMIGKLMTMLLPLPQRQCFDDPDYLHKSHGLQSSEINTVFLSHFHADHIGGWSLFPLARYVYRVDCLTSLQTAPWKQRMKHGFLRELVPSNIASQSNAVIGLESSPLQFSCLRVIDYFRDGSLYIVDLPGHAKGHMGYLLRISASELLFYIVDAFWDRKAWESNCRLPWISEQVAHDRVAYLATQSSLRDIWREHQLNPIACHCPLTQSYVVPIEN
jgi:glyoxylase-like metal-dependent hydrolase (beta-lactamase superfamily II)